MAKNLNSKAVNAIMRAYTTFTAMTTCDDCAGSGRSR
jgi:hypothetical protein